MSVERLTKILSLTDSDSDGEALNALRKAQKIMKEMKIGWPDLVAGKLGSLKTHAVMEMYPGPFQYYPPPPNMDDLNSQMNSFFHQNNPRGAQAQAQARAQAAQGHVRQRANVASINSKIIFALRSPNVPELNKRVLEQIAKRIITVKTITHEELEAVEVAYGLAIGRPYREPK